MKKVVVDAVNHSISKLMCYCNAPLDFFALCTQCGALNEVIIPDPFELFGLDEKFHLILPDLTRTYLQLQNKLHPDRFPVGSPSQSLAQQYASHINNAYNLLKNPLKRAELLLQKYSPVLSPNELMEQWDLRERLETISTQEEITSFARQTLDSILKTHQSMAQFFETRDYPQASICLARLKFLHRLQDEIQVKKRSFEC